MTDSVSLGTAGGAAQTAPARSGSLFHPIADFIFLGGGSLVVLALFWLFLGDLPVQDIFPYVLLTAHFINHPHFAYSYQIFYRRFAAKVLGRELPGLLRARYVFAGVVVPAALVLFFVVCIARGDARLIGYAGNFMVFTVGWHYAKQGYGMIIVDSVLKRLFFSQNEKRLLLLNAHVCWVLFYVWTNQSLHETDLWGLKYYTFDFPDLLVTVLGAAALATSAATAGMLGRKWARDGGTLPLNGIAAYIASIYVWLLATKVGPLIIVAAAPAFHSLQYQYVVWRYQLNVERARDGSGYSPGAAGKRWYLPRLASLRFALFTIIGMAIGYLGFWAIPKYLNAAVAYDHGIFGETMFLFVFWIFINVHHYFLDNVIWRAENPETGRHLFAHG
ncbi:MAG: hypothetical protein JSU82_05485 [Rhodospirillales bacterium]|nr:MAG: hypothetical protein JSU82_05485 [Rhodospirillales bacterium]